MKKRLKLIYKTLVKKEQLITLDYRVNPVPRYGHGKPPHQQLYAIINENREVYRSNLISFLEYTNQLQEIQPSSLDKEENKPTWINNFLPGLDIVGIYGMIANYKPNTYIEIGSGNSTKVARKAIKDHQLDTKIISIDPFPRANIDHLSDEIIRKPFEDISDYSFILDTLSENDILFIDNSHRVFPNSDSMISFLEILPLLKKGVIVHIHDIYLPYDYPQFMCDRFYNEQYVLAAFVIANPIRYKTILPNYFISEDPELAKVISPIWNHKNLERVEKHGGSYWIQIN